MQSAVAKKRIIKAEAGVVKRPAKRSARPPLGFDVEESAALHNAISLAAAKATVARGK
jgi:hypothetical protein